MRTTSYMPVLCLALLLTSSACTTSWGQRDSAVQGTESASPFAPASPFIARVANPKALASVNAVYLAPIVLSQQAARSNVVDLGLDERIKEVAKRELSMKVIASVSGKNAQGERGYIDAARKAGADAVLITRIETFVERSGSTVGGEPAVVGFSMSMVRCRDGVEAWRGDYNFRDQPLSDNLLKLGQSQGGGRGWQSARDVILTGISVSIRDFNERRLSQFTAVKK